MHLLEPEGNQLLDEINSNPKLNNNGQRKFYDAKKIRITLHGTGLFHFKAGLGKFDSFEDVTGYFIVRLFRYIIHYFYTILRDNLHV
jgi:hypothetical protein